LNVVNKNFSSPSFSSSPSILKDILQWDWEIWQIPLKFWEEKVPWEKVHTCMEIGAKRGGLTLWLSYLKEKECYCTDIVDPKPLAYPLHQKYFQDPKKLEKKIRYGKVDATRMNESEKWDCIVLKSVLGDIGAKGNNLAQEVAIQKIYRALKPGGFFLFAENLKGSFLHQIGRRFVPWGKDWNYPTLSRIYTLLLPFSEKEIRTIGFFYPFGKKIYLRKIALSLDLLLDPLIPLAEKYIVYGIARK